MKWITPLLLFSIILFFTDCNSPVKKEEAVKEIKSNNPVLKLKVVRVNFDLEREYCFYPMIYNNSDTTQAITFLDYSKTFSTVTEMKSHKETTSQDWEWQSYDGPRYVEDYEPVNADHAIRLKPGESKILDDMYLRIGQFITLDGEFADYEPGKYTIRFETAMGLNGDTLKKKIISDTVSFEIKPYP